MAAVGNGPKHMVAFPYVGQHCRVPKNGDLGLGIKQDPIGINATVIAGLREHVRVLRQRESGSGGG